MICSTIYNAVTMADLVNQSYLFTIPSQQFTKITTTEIQLALLINPIPSIDAACVITF